MPVGDWVRSYPVYFPGREPEGYWQMLQSKKPEPLITPEPARRAEWIEQDGAPFEEMDVPGFRTNDPKFINRTARVKSSGNPVAARSKTALITGWRWVPTSSGLALSISECSGCHARIMPDGSLLDGAQGDDPSDDIFFDILQARERSVSSRRFAGDGDLASIRRAVDPVRHSRPHQER